LSASARQYARQFEIGCAPVGTTVKSVTGKTRPRISIHRARVERLRQRLEHETDEKRRQMIQAQLVALDPRYER
jgi:hypothetical protein